MRWSKFLRRFQTHLRWHSAGLWDVETFHYDSIRQKALFLVFRTVGRMLLVRTCALASFRKPAQQLICQSVHEAN